jgi:LuxR family maltose regulon positive regulatory protein
VVKSLLQHNVRVLAMKLQFPLTDSSHVKRDNVLDIISRVDDSTRVFLIEAAPGYGKSLCLSQFIQQKIQASENAIWITLDPKENEAKRLVTYICSGLNTSSSNLAVQALSQIEQGENSDTVFHTLMEEISLFPSKIYLALDDIHHLTSDTSLSLLNDLITYAPKNLTLYLTTRDKPLLSLAKLVASSTVKIITEKDLSFSLLETREWLSKNIGTELTELQIDQFYAISLGWPQGLELLKNIYIDVGYIEVQGDELILTDYIEQEWLNFLTEAELLIIKQLAVLGIANRAYFNAVFGYDDANKILAKLSARHVFILVKKQKKSWYFVHPMFQSLLVDTMSQNEKKKIYQLACNWLHKQELNVAAVEMALKSGDKLRASELLELSGDRILEQQDIAQLLQWRKKIPDSVITASPRLIIVFSWALALAQQLDEAERLMAQMSRQLSLDKKTINDEFSGQLLSIRAYVARGRGNVDNAIYLCKQAIEKLPAKDLIARGITFFSLSNSYMTINKLSSARDYNKLLYETARFAGSLHLEMLAIHEQARIEQIKGNLNITIKLLDNGLLLSEQQPHREKVAAYGRLLIYKGYILWLQNNILESESLIRLGMQVSERCHDSYIMMGFVLRSNIARQRGQIEQAFDQLANGEALMQRWVVPTHIFQPWLSAMRANLLLDEGKFESALSKLNKLYGLLEHNPYALSPEHYPGLRGLVDVFLVRAKSISGNHQDALSYLDKNIEKQQTLQHGFALIVIYIMRALLRYQLGQEEEAIQDFRKALTMAESDKNIMPFIEYSSGMNALYGHLPQEIKSSPFVSEILQSIELTPNTDLNRTFAKSKAVLSQREIGVLQLIAQGMSNQEIAEKLFISLHTVKTHARRINAKLEVKSRTQATIKAKELALM